MFKNIINRCGRKYWSTLSPEEIEFWRTPTRKGLVQHIMQHPQGRQYFFRMLWYRHAVPMLAWTLGAALSLCLLAFFIWALLTWGH